MDVKHGTPPTRVTTGKNFLYRGEVYDGKIYITTNEDAPRYRVFVADAGNYEREAWKELIPQADAVLQGVGVYGGKLFAQYEQNATSQLKLFDLDGKKLDRHRSSGDWHRLRNQTAAGIATRRFSASSLLRCRPPSFTST